ncbi:putative type IX sorting system protein PorV2 [Neptunitalea chrysea]|uniref:putative type IX sorting system protein PorV2 n=1 Tax=Neptunitalea chrysea TaxID=1647581 RepID=UPI0024939B42|nr:PorV/PorQ family protein [Neptunitalea chrysea]
MRNPFFLILILFTASFAFGQTTKYSNEFMNIGVDARAFGMANAVVAHTDDVNSGYWNPAGLIHLEDKQIALMHAAYFANIAQYDYVGFAMPIDHYSALGVSFIRFGVDDIMNTTQLIDSQGNIDYDRISLFSAADYGVVFSYTRKPVTNDYLSYGGNAKVIRRVIGDFASSWGFGFDLALQYQRDDWSFGVMLRDITTTYNTWQIDEDIFDGVSDQIPEQEIPETTEVTLPKAQIGVSRKFVFNFDYTLLAEVDLNMRFAETNDIFSSESVSMTPAVGFEFGYRDMVFVRAGAGNFQNELQLDGSENMSFQPNIGAGFRYKSIQVDYALTDIGDQSAAIYSNVFSVRVDWKLFR